MGSCGRVPFSATVSVPNSAIVIFALHAGFPALAQEGWYDNRPHSFQVYAPARTCVVYGPADYVDPLQVRDSGVYSFVWYTTELFWMVVSLLESVAASRH